MNIKIEDGSIRGIFMIKVQFFLRPAEPLYSTERPQETDHSSLN